MRAYQLLLITICGFLACNLFKSTTAVLSTNENVTIFGHCSPYAHKIRTERVYKKAKWLRVVEEERTINSYGPRISCVIARNTKTNGHPAKVLLASGGENFNYSTLHFASQRSHGIHFDVELWG